MEPQSLNAVSGIISKPKKHDIRMTQGSLCEVATFMWDALMPQRTRRLCQQSSPLQRLFSLLASHTISQFTFAGKGFKVFTNTITRKFPETHSHR